MVESYKSNPTVHRVEGTAMEQDFTKGLSVCIGNYGYYNEGELHDTWITLPKTEAEIRDFLHLNRLQDPLHEEIYISDYDGVPFGATQLFTEFCHLEDLNLLAKQLVTANPADLEKVGAWIQANDTPESLVGLMNLIEQADDIPFYSWGYDGAYDKDEFGNMIYTTLRDDGESDRDANGRDALDAVPDGTYDPLPTVADGYTLSNSELEAFNRLCSLSIKTVRGAVRNEAAKQYAKRLGEGYSPATIEKAYIDYAEAYRQNNPSPRFAKQLSDWFVKSDGFAYFAKKPVIRTTTATKATSGQDSDLRAATEAKNDRLTLAATDPTFRDLEAAVSKARSLWGHACMTSDVENASRLKEEWSKATERANEYYETHCTSAVATA